MIQWGVHLKHDPPLSPGDRAVETRKPRDQRHALCPERWGNIDKSGQNLRTHPDGLVADGTDHLLADSERTIATASEWSLPGGWFSSPVRIWAV